MRAIPRPARRLLGTGLLSLAVVSGAAAPARAGDTDTAGGSYVAVTRDASGDLSVERIEVRSSRELSAEVRALDAGGDVLAVEAEDTVSALGTDPLRPEQWSLDTVAFEAVRPVTSGEGVVVAVIDSGVDARHEDLAGMVLPGWDTVNNRAGGQVDTHGHGTHVAGIIAARAGNGTGTAGAAPGVRILPVRVLGPTGAGSLTDVSEGIVWAVDHGADIINLSLGGNGGASIYRSVISYARQQGVLVVAAAGNEALKGNPVVYPGADPDAVAVANVTPSRTRAASSTYGSWVDIAAPGSGIVAPCPAAAQLCPADPSESGLPAGYGRLSGTSMAAPHVAAAAALVLSARPNLTPAAVASLLAATADDLGASGLDPEFGAGLVDPYEAVGPRPAPVPTPAPSAPAPTPAPDAAPGPSPQGGYWVIGGDGRVAPFGSAPDLGGVANPSADIVAAATTPSGHGYWLAGADGAIYAFGDATFFGSMGGHRLNSPIAGLAATTTGRGYWLLGADGGVFSFGDARFFGSTGGMRLNRPVVDMAPTPSGNGYWLVATDGGIFAYGDAGFFGSTGGIALARPVVSLAPAAGGYWMVGADGGIFAFGQAAFHGSLPGLHTPNLPEGKRIRALDGGDGYYLLGADGRVFAFGAAADHGSAPGFSAVDLVLAP